MTNSEIHWFSIINSIMMVLFLTGVVAMILLRTLRRDLERYNSLDDDDDTDETGWKVRYLSTRCWEKHAHKNS